MAGRRSEQLQSKTRFEFGYKFLSPCLLGEFCIITAIFRIISVFDIVFLSRIAYTINAQKARKRGGVSMATSSITHNFVVSNPKSVKRFVAAIDEADRDRTPKQTLPGRQLTNPQEILALMSKRKKKHV